MRFRGYRSGFQMGEQRLISPAPQHRFVSNSYNVQEKTNSPKARLLRSQHKSRRDDAPIFSAIRPQTPFASILPASARRPMRSRGQWENQSQSALSPAGLPSLEFRGMERPASRPA